MRNRRDYCDFRSKYASADPATDECYSHRPAARSKIMGVCAGLARQFDWDVTLVRLVAVLSLFCFTLPTALAYIFLGSLFY